MEKNNHLLMQIIVIGLALILFILPFPRGLFFEKEILPVQAVCFLLFGLWAIYKIRVQERIQINSLLAIGVCLMPVAYILPLLFGQAASRYSALQYILRYCTYAVVFFMLADLTKTRKHLFGWLQVLGISGFCTAVLGIDSALGEGLNRLFGFGGTIDIYGRVQGVLQYPNSYGAYLGMVFFMLLGLGILTEHTYHKGIYGGMMVPVLAALFLTVSRGAIAMVPVIFIGLILVLPTKQKRLEAILLSTFPIVSTILLIQPLQSLITGIQQAITAQQTYGGMLGKAWMYVILGIIGAGIGTMLVSLLAARLEKVPGRVYTIGLSAIAVMGVISTLVIWQTGLYTKLLPEFLLQRFGQLGSITEITSGRNNFYRDGVALLKDKWLLGAGGNAWNAMYRMYQSYDYGSSEAHSLPLQVWIETGVFGILSLLFLAVATWVLYFKTCRTRFGTEQAIFLMILWMLLSHSVVDFNFSYLSLPLIGFGLMGCMNGLQEKEKTRHFASIPGWAGTALGCILFLFPAAFMVSRQYAAQATTIMRQEELKPQDVIAAIEKMKDAMAWNGWNAPYIASDKYTEPEIQIDLSKLYEIRMQFDQSAEAVQEYMGLLQKAAKLEPYNPTANIKAAQPLISSHRFDEGLARIERGRELQPMASGRYEEVAQSHYVIGEFYEQQGAVEEAKRMYSRIAQLEEDVRIVNERALEPVVLNETTKGYIEQAKERLADMQ